MKTWAIVVTVIVFSLPVWAQDPPTQCKRYVHTELCPDCYFIQITLGDGACRIEPVELCTTCGGGGMCALKAIGMCPSQCTSTVISPDALAKLLKLPQNTWLGRKYFSETLSAYSFYVGKAIRILQEQLQAEGTTTEEWELTKLVMGSRHIDGKDPYIADLKYTNKEWVLVITRHKWSTDGDGEEYGAKWTLRMTEKGWTLESTEGMHGEGNFE